MKCEKCGAEFNPPKEFIDSLEECPFCGATFFDKEIAESCTSFSEFLQYIVFVYGEKIYQDKSKLSTLITELYNGEQRLKRAYIHAVIDDSISQKIYDISLKPLEERKIFYNKVISDFAEANFCTPEVSKCIIDCFVDGIYLGLEFMSKECQNLLNKANNGDKYAQNNLGYCYGHGQGVRQDYVEAVKWYRRSAEQGCDTAQYNLGICYEYGQGVQQNYVEAVKWYRKSAEQGNAGAQNILKRKELIK